MSQVIQNSKTSQACDMLRVHAFVCISVSPTPRHRCNSHQVALIQWLCCRCHPSKKRLHQHRGSKPLQGTTGATWLFYSTTPQRDSITTTTCLGAWTWMPTKQYIYIHIYVCIEFEWILQTLPFPCSKPKPLQPDVPCIGFFFDEEITTGSLAQATYTTKCRSRLISKQCNIMQSRHNLFRNGLIDRHGLLPLLCLPEAEMTLFAKTECRPTNNRHW